MAEDVEVLWERFWGGDQSVRNDLVLHYQHLVQAVARRLSVPSSVDREDLASNGMFGLIDAVERYDPSYGFKFETYAYRRIHGAIIDGLRSMDWAPRPLRALAREIEMAEGEVAALHGSLPGDKAIEERLGWEPGKLQSVRSALNEAKVESIDVAASASEGETTSLHEVVSDDAISPTIELELKDLRGRLAQALSDLDERASTILTLYYFEKLKFSEIGELFDVSESRICQIHMQAIEDLRSSLI